MTGYCTKFACQCDCKLLHMHCAVLHQQPQKLPANFDVSNLFGASSGNLAINKPGKKS